MVEPTPIDEKKKEKGNDSSSSSSSSANDWKQFAKSFCYSLLVTICIQIFLIGSLGLYTSKVALSNILPDDLDQMPYSGVERLLFEQPIDINIMRPSLFSPPEESVSQPVLFDGQAYADSFYNSFLCSMKRNANPSGDNNWFANPFLYLASVYEAIIANNFGFVNRVFRSFAYLPDSITMIAYGWFGFIIWFLFYLYNIGFSLFYHVVNIPHLFRQHVQQDANEKTWEPSDQISFFRIGKWIAFCCLWFPLGLLSAFLSPLFFTLYGLIAPLYATYHKKDRPNQSLNVFSFLADAFRYKTYMLFLLTSLSLLSNGSKTLDTPYVIGIVLAICIAYMLNFYSNTIPQPGQDGFQSLSNPEVQVAKQNRSAAKRNVPICPDDDDNDDDDDTSSIQTDGEVTNMVDEREAKRQNTEEEYQKSLQQHLGQLDDQTTQLSNTVLDKLKSADQTADLLNRLGQTLKRGRPIVASNSNLEENMKKQKTWKKNKKNMKKQNASKWQMQWEKKRI